MCDRVCEVWSGWQKRDRSSGDTKIVVGVGVFGGDLTEGEEVSEEPELPGPLSQDGRPACRVPCALPQGCARPWGAGLWGWEGGGARCRGSWNVPHGKLTCVESCWMKEKKNSESYFSGRLVWPQVWIRVLFPDRLVRKFGCTLQPPGWRVKKE